MKIHKLKIAGLFIVYMLLFIGSSTQKKVTEQPLEVIEYDFTPPLTAPAKSAKIAFLLLNPRYATSFKYSGLKMFSDFSESMANDFNEMLTARGFSVRGPFENYDAIVYSDKKESDLMLEVQIDLSVNTSNVKWETKFQPGYPHGNYVYTFDGSIILSGKVNLTASETISREKLWAKSIPVEQRMVTVSSNHIYNVPNDLTNAFATDAGLVNPMSEEMQSLYQSIMKTAWNQLEPADLSNLQPQIKEIREKKKY